MDNNNDFLNDENESRKEILPEGSKNESGMKGFIWGFLIILLPYIAMFFYYKMYSGLEIIGGFFLAVLFVIIGILLWAIIRFGLKKRFWALGFLTGGLATLLIMFVFTGGCGLFGRNI